MTNNLFTYSKDTLVSKSFSWMPNKKLLIYSQKLLMVQLATWFLGDKQEFCAHPPVLELSYLVFAAQLNRRLAASGQSGQCLTV